MRGKETAPEYESACCELLGERERTKSKMTRESEIMIIGIVLHTSTDNHRRNSFQKDEESYTLVFASSHLAFSTKCCGGSVVPVP
jgi:hypothetical protein